jgi:hypothetical protein
MSKMNPDPLDVASWAIKLLRFENFHCNDESQFFDAFFRAYRASKLFIIEFNAVEKTTCPKIYENRMRQIHTHDDQSL